MLRRLIASGVLLLAPTPVMAQESIRGLRAERVDLVLELLIDGSLQVDETIVFRFSGRTFSEVERTVPVRRTDGIIDVQALIDGRPVPEGRGDNQVRLTLGRRELRALWRFEDVTDVARAFTLRYRAVGVAAVEPGRQTIRWHVLPTRHRYPIDEASVTWRVPSGVRSLAGPALEAEGWAWRAAPDGTWRATKAAVAANEAAVLTDAFPSGALAMSSPVWQVDDERARQLAPAFVVGAAVILVMGAGVVAMMRLRYHRPRVDRSVALPAEHGSLPPALGTALIGAAVRLGFAHMSATLFDLIARGRFTVEETSARGVKASSRTFDLVAASGAATGEPLRPHEQVIVDAMWLRMKHGRLPLKQGQTALSRARRSFTRAAREELDALGLVDAERVWAARGLRTAGLLAILVGVAGLVVFAAIGPRLGDAALLVPAAVVIMGLGFVVVGQAFPTLSQEGARLSAQWAARARLLREAARKGPAAETVNRWLPVAIGLGLGTRFVKHGVAVSWLAGITDVSSVLPIVLAAGGTSSHGHGGGGGAGGAGGGGSSGAR